MRRTTWPLRELGICINYNSYGAAVADLHVAPDDLYRRLRHYSNPLDFIAQDPAFRCLREGYASDMAQARGTPPTLAAARHRLYILPADAWARRASGVLANELTHQSPACAHALLTRLPAGGFLVSVRAPLTGPQGADRLCREFATGGGRTGAAGINHLPDADYDRFVERFIAAF